MNRFLFVFPLLAAPVFGAVDFSHQVVPVLTKYCAECHLGDKKKGSFSMNTRKDLMEGSENGKVLTIGKADDSTLIKALLSHDKDEQMPPKGDRVPAEQIAILKQWINDGAVWDDGFTFGKSNYEPLLKPRIVTLPAAVDGRENPIDRILDTYMAAHKVKRPQALSDEAFARRLHLDVVGLLPDPEIVRAFVADTAPDKRAKLIASVLARDVDYAEHWLTFWNDLLRNDYAGTGYVDGGRKQISNWLYQSLVSNKPYDQFTRELLAPSGDAEGFINGIKWRGNVNASQVREIQFSQSICQVFLGINMKCASCHDSFIDRWKLDEAYNLAAIYADQPLEVNRCDKGTGRMAKAAWLFPELGNVKPEAPKDQRLKQLAALMTHKENGRFTRTIVNRLWHRLMGRGIVHPVDAMNTEPWSTDLLDYLAVRLSDDGYDLKKLLALIANSQAYQSQSITSHDALDSAHFTYAGPIAKRLTAEQFVDAVWQLTGTGPKAPNGAILRGKPDTAAKASALWIWSNQGGRANANDKITLRKRITLKTAPKLARAVVNADNEYELIVNNKSMGGDADIHTAETYSLGASLRQGVNTIMLVVTNGGKGPNAAGAWLQVDVETSDGSKETFTTDNTWEWTTSVPKEKGKFDVEPKDWQPAFVVKNQAIWKGFDAKAQSAIAQGGKGVPPYVRASLVTSDLLMRSLGRPNREQIVTVRPDNLTTLEAIDLANGNILAGYLKQGSERLAAASPSAEPLVRSIFERALSRSPTAAELALMTELTGSKPTAQGVEDMLWSVLLLPEFEFVR